MWSWGSSELNISAATIKRAKRRVTGFNVVAGATRTACVASLPGEDL